MPTFKEAFSSARGAGKKVFTWNGKRYTTELKKTAKTAPSKSPTPKAKPKASTPVPKAKPKPKSTTKSTSAKPTSTRAASPRASIKNRKERAAKRKAAASNKAPKRNRRTTIFDNIKWW